MRPFAFIVSFILVATAVSPASSQSNQQLGPLCTSENTPADKQIDACNKIIALKVFSGPKLAAIYFWRAVGYNKKGDYNRVILDVTEALKLQPDQTAMYNLRGSAYYDKGEYDIAIADFSDAIRLGPPSSTVFHNRGNAYRSKRDYPHALADYSEAIRLEPQSAFSFQNRGAVKQAMGDLDGALEDINAAIRLNPQLPTTLINRSVLWRAKNEYDRAITDTTEALRLAQSGVPVPVMTPPGSWQVSGRVNRGLAYEARGDLDQAKADFSAALTTRVADAGSIANQATAKARLAVIAATTVSAAPAPTPAAAPAPTPAAPPVATSTKPEPSKKNERRIALVIGNGAYANFGKLPNPPNDARTVAKSLRDIGFEVTEGYDLSQAALQGAVNGFLRSATGAKVAVFYYAGHGAQIDGRNFLVPVDLRPDSPQNVLASMTNVDTILAGLDDQVRTNIVILDACRNNPMAEQPAPAAGRGLKIGNGLAAPAALAGGAMFGAGTLIAFATAPGQVALDGEGGNSPFSGALSRHVGTPGLEVQQMLTRVRAEVVATTKSKQVPWSNSSLLGEVYLAGAKQ
jgi:tetratricopeptide (TPR) repeat protein